jgi:hypothetical protein
VRDTQGRPTDAERRESRHESSFLWFTRAGKAYLVADRESLARVGEVHRAARPQLLGERLRELADELLRDGAARPAELDGP